MFITESETYLYKEEPFLTLGQDRTNVINPNSDYKQISFLAVGDNIIYNGTTRDAKGMAVEGGRAYNYKPIYSEVAEYISQADVAFINQETLMCGEKYGYTAYPMFNCPQDAGYDLCELGFDVVNIANNHMLDKFSKGLQDAIAFWKTMPVTLIGGYTDENDYNNIRIHEKNGIRIAFLSYTYGTNNIKQTAGYKSYVPYLDEADIEKQVDSVRGKADLVFVSVHWGNEGSFKPSGEQKQYAQRFADAGVDVVLGHHPHVLQPIEWIKGKDGTKTLCVYSLGNFMAMQDYDYNMVGGMLTFDIVKYEDNKPLIENIVFTPTVYDFEKITFKKSKVYLLEDYTQSQALNHGIGHWGNKTTLEKLRKYVSDVIADEYLPESYKESLKK